MATSHLKAKVQSRIDALTHPTPAFDLQQHAIDTVGLNLDLTNIISVVNSATANIATATADEITALNTASVALGITVKTNSGIVPINGLIPISSNKPLVEYQGQTYLITGSLEDDIDSYPDAAIDLIVGTGDDTIFIDTSVNVNNALDVTYCAFDDTFYITDASDSYKVKKYRKATGLYIGELPTLEYGGVQVNGICAVGDKLWGVSGVSAYREILIFDLDGNFIEYQGAQLIATNTTGNSFFVDELNNIAGTFVVGGSVVQGVISNLTTGETHLPQVTVGTGLSIAGAVCIKGITYVIVQRTGNSQTHLVKMYLDANGELTMTAHGDLNIAYDNTSRHGLTFDGERLVVANRSASGDGLSSLVSYAGVGCSTYSTTGNGTIQTPNYARIK